MLIKKSINSSVGLFISAVLWAITFNHQDWICATRWQELQRAIAQFEFKSSALPPFGLWEGLASSDFRLKNQLLSLYFELGAKERAGLFAVSMAAELSAQPHSEQSSFLQICIWLDNAPHLQSLAIKTLRADDKENPVWIFHQHMLYKKRVPEVTALESAEKELLAHYLTEIGEVELAMQIYTTT